MCRLVARGRWFNFYAQTRPNGDCPAWDYVEALPEAEQIPIITLIQHIATIGSTANPKKFSQLHGGAKGLLELRSYQHRIFSFYGGNDPDGRPTVIMTNGYRKKKQETSPAEIARALDGKQAYELERWGA